MRKKLITGAALLALLMNAPQVSAEEDVVIFGGEFEDEANLSKPQKKSKPVEEPAPPKVEKPKEKPAPPKPKVDEPKEEPPIVQKPERQPIIDEPKDEPPPIVQKPERQPIIDEPKDEPPPIVQPPPPINQPTIETLPPVEEPFKQQTEISGGQQERLDEPNTKSEPSASRRSILPPSSLSNNAAPQQNLKTLKPRFLKLAVDDTYTYYLDKTSVQWKRVPYLANEYMADVWIRMIEREPAPLNDDMAYYGAENFRAEVASAREQGYQYSPEDLKVLKSQSYVLEHYYLRPKTKQIQFLCELEVFGRPQNAINERAYDNKNWEYLVPGSVESLIYEATIKIIGKSKATERGHMTFIDMLDEYARIALN